MSQDSRNACFQDGPVAFIIFKYLLAGFVTWWSYEPVKLESGWLYTTETQSRAPACVNQCSSPESDRAGSIYSRWGALVTGDIAPKWPVIRHHSAFSLFWWASTAALQTTACYATCWPFAYSKGHWCLSHALREVRGKPPEQELWHCFSLIWALLWIPGVFQRLCLPALCGHERQPLIPGWHRFLPFAVALRHRGIVRAWLQFLRIPALWALGAAASLSPASENHLYY